MGIFKSLIVNTIFQSCPAIAETGTIRITPHQIAEVIECVIGQMRIKETAGCQNQINLKRFKIKTGNRTISNKIVRLKFSPNFLPYSLVQTIRGHEHVHIAKGLLGAIRRNGRHTALTKRWQGAQPRQHGLNQRKILVPFVPTRLGILQCVSTHMQPLFKKERDMPEFHLTKHIISAYCRGKTSS